jgi:hypothetical protein
MADRIDVLFPVARVVTGNLYTPNTTDAEGNPLVIKTGPNAGQPREDYYFGIAIPKGTEQHWNQTEWGSKIYQAGANAFPNDASQSPTFAWKIADGDSTVPNRVGTKPCDRVGWAGNWVVHLSSSFAPKLYTDNGNKQLLEKDAIKCGYFVEVFGSVGGNGSSQQPGVFINHSMVNLVAYGEVINTGPDATKVGFGASGGALPPGASATPPAQAGGFNPGATPPPPPAQAGATPPPPPAQPHTEILNPANAAAQQTPPPPPPPAQPDPLDAYRKAGWTDDQLRAAGMLQ